MWTSQRWHLYFTVCMSHHAPLSMVQEKRLLGWWLTGVFGKWNVLSGNSGWSCWSVKFPKFNKEVDRAANTGWKADKIYVERLKKKKGPVTNSLNVKYHPESTPAPCTPLGHVEEPEFDRPAVAGYDSWAMVRQLFLGVGVDTQRSMDLLFHPIVT